jgi:prolyl 4-hydroxylase
VKPRKGGALLWPSTLSDDPSKIDHRTLHAALPVVEGIKFAANTWIHSHDFATSNLWGCTGTFDELTQ